MENIEKKKWYDNKAVVIILLVVFFPVGLYALWKSKSFSTMTKGIITGVVFLLLIVAGAQDDGKEGVSVKKPTVVKVREIEEHIGTSISKQKIGVSYEQVMQYFRSEKTVNIKMKEFTLDDGQTAYRGITDDGTAQLYIIGDKSDISQASLLVGLPNDAPKIKLRNLAMILRFLGNLVPEWSGREDWAASTLAGETYTSSPTVGNKFVHMISLPPLIVYTVKHN